MHTPTNLMPRILSPLLLAALLLPWLVAPTARAQDTVTGAFEGVVRDKVTDRGIRGAVVEIINEASGVSVLVTTDLKGYFYRALLNPGTYTLLVSSHGYQSAEVRGHSLVIARSTVVVPRPVELENLSASLPPERARPVRRSFYSDALVVFLVPARAEGATTTTSVTPRARHTAPPQRNVAPTVINAGQKIFEGSLYRGDARHEGSFEQKKVTSLPIGSTTLVRSFDELALLLPGIAPPPETVGNGSGPGVGAGVGSSGQFSANGLRSRANNFTVDGSDNNDEDIGVRRQGFFALVPQPVESIQEYQVITLLAPAQFGRNLGAQVNAVSRSGGRDFHGALYGLFNSSQLNARNFFDRDGGGDGLFALRSGAQPVLSAPEIIFPRDFNLSTLNFAPPGLSPVTVRGEGAGEDSFTLGQGGFVFGGAITPARLFYFVSAEGHLLNASRELSFAVPTVAERGVFGTGATGIHVNPFTGLPTFAFPTTRGGDAVFSLFPFPNNPGGLYGENTFTRELPASARGVILSGKLDYFFKLGGRAQQATLRYNFTNDWRVIPSTGGALFSTLKPRVRTQNVSFFLNSTLSAPGSSASLFNQIRLSYGRTRLRFAEVRDTTYLVPSDSFPGTPFLLNAERYSNFTLPNLDAVNDVLVPNTGPVLLQRAGAVEEILGPIGQVIIAGYSPAGADVFNFPQRRVNNTYQFADQLTVHRGDHNFAFGMDNRRTELNSILPRNFRPLITFYGAPRLGESGGDLVITNDFIRPVDLAAVSAASGFFQTLTTGSDSGINLRFYQFNFYAQDEWRVLPNLSISAGMRYEYNTPPREVNGRIEATFDDPALSLVHGLRQFIDGRTRIFEPDSNNLSPRVGFAYSPHLFGPPGSTALRAGYGHYNDQILGAVVSQSRSVFPTYVTVNAAGGLGNLLTGAPLGLLNFADPRLDAGLVQPGTLNRLDPSYTLADQLAQINLLASARGALPGASGIEVTLPSRRLSTPGAHHYSLSFEQRIGTNLIVSVAYVGTRGHDLLRFTTPNFGPNAVSLVSSFDVDFTGTHLFAGRFEPQFHGVAVAPGTRIEGGDFTGGRPVADAGGVLLYGTTARSRYDAGQFGVRGRFQDALDYRVDFTLSKALDDVSDVFDMAGAPALAQDSLDLESEYGPANFDVRRMLSFYSLYDFPRFRRGAARALFGGAQLIAAGRFRTGQPFTVNSTFDVNLDGNLTDRLNSTDGLLSTGDRSRPLLLTTQDINALRAVVGEDGQLGRNTFRAGNVFELDMAFVKIFRIDEARAFVVRTEVFNLTNRANFGVPVRFLEAPGFGQTTSTLTPGRRVQFFLKYLF